MGSCDFLEDFIVFLKVFQYIALSFFYVLIIYIFAYFEKDRAPWSDVFDASKNKKNTKKHST